MYRLNSNIIQLISQAQKLYFQQGQVSPVFFQNEDRLFPILTLASFQFVWKNVCQPVEQFEAVQTELINTLHFFNS